MKYVITGSTGHISKPVAIELVKNGHEVTIISSKADKTKEIESIGAKALIGSVEEVAFLKKAFAGADAVYLMIPPKWTVTNWLEYQKAVADNYAEAVKAAAVKNVVILSSVGAHMKKGCGPVDGTAYLEDKIKALDSVRSLAVRPSYFYYNLFSMIPMIKNAGIMGSTQSPDHKLVLTHTDDIAAVVSSALLKLDFSGHGVQYIASDEQSWKDITKVLAQAISKPELPFIEFTDEQSLQGMLGAGLSSAIAEGYVAMGKALRSGEMEADYWKNKPAQLGKVKLSDFAEEFAAAYNAG